MNNEIKIHIGASAGVAHISALESASIENILKSEAFVKNVINY